jgi:hypothetical protein
VDCVGSLGFTAPLSTGEVFNPTNTPAAGTETLSNIAGEMTTPASGAIFTWTARAAASYVVTAISAEGIVAGTSGKGAATATGGGSGSTSTATITGAGKSAAMVLQPRIPALVGSAMALGFCLFL